LLTATICSEIKASTITSFSSILARGWLGATISALDGVLTAIGE
jgi:hypothetical protein